MVSRRSLRLAVALLVALLASALGGTAPLSAAPDEDKGSTYRNPEMGVTAKGPAGWKMVADKGRGATRWQRLVTFNDTDTDAQATLSARSRKAVRLDDLMAAVRKDWDASQGELRVSSMRKIEGTQLSPVGTVIVDASFVRKGKPAAGTPGALPPPPVSYRVQATYFLAPGQEYLLYAVGQQAHWGRLRTPLQELRASIEFETAEDTGPKGAGTYRNDRFGFICTFPIAYTVVTPQRANHVVQFSGVGAEDPVLGVYAFRWEESIEQDAERLVQYYEEEKGGEASVGRMEVGGREAMLVKGRATVGGEDRAVLLAIFKRGDTCFRLRASMPQDAETKGETVFRRFVSGFRLRSAPK